MEGHVSSIFVLLSQSPPFKPDLILDVKKTLVCPYSGSSSKYHYSGQEWGIFYFKSFCLRLGNRC